MQLKDTGHKIKVMSLENYLTGARAELSKNEITAFKIILNTQIYNYLKEHPFEKSHYYAELLTSKYLSIESKEISEQKHYLDSGQKVKGKLEEKENEHKN
ncbi:MAG: hypothetical protein IPG53_17050 [Ignavibacteriales bacterium]|nr:hypothetical protein [Ignavibacteriales bacterium]